VSISILGFTVWASGWTIVIWGLAPQILENYRRLPKDHQATALTGGRADKYLDFGTVCWVCVYVSYWAQGKETVCLFCLRVILGTR
jgi:hypothetical protein